MQLICAYHINGPLPSERGPYGAPLVGDPDEVVEKIVRYSKALGGGIPRISFQMDPGSLSQEKLMRAIELVGTRIVPALREELDRNKSRKEEFNKKYLMHYII
jgi:hypothetical protein